MKIIDVQWHAVQAPGRTLVVVTVETDAGIMGLGEAGLQRRWRSIGGAVEHLRAWMVGQDPARIEYLWQRMFRGGFYPGDRIIGSAIAAVDIALWDIKGQALGAPVYDLLGGRCRDYVQCFLSPTYRPSVAGSPPNADDCFRAMTVSREPCEMAELAVACLEAGHRYFRIGPDADGDLFDSRRAIQRLVDQLRAVRSRVGNKLELMVDAHARFSPEEAVWFCQQVEDLGLLLVEDPIRSEHVAGYRRLRQHTRVPLAAGEQWANKWEFREAIEEELIDYARVDVCIAGGLTEARKIAAMCEAHMVRILPHNPLGPVCTAASLHLNIACENAGPQEVVFPPAQMLPDVFRCEFTLDGTRLTVPTAPGLGVSFDRKRAADYPADMTEPPHFHRPDGSYTNY